MISKEEVRRTVKAATATVRTMNHSDDRYLKSQGFCIVIFDVQLFNDDEMVRAIGRLKRLEEEREERWRGCWSMGNQ